MRQSVENFFNWLSDEFVGRAMLGYVIFTALIIVSLDYTVKSLLINWHIIPFPPLPTSTDTPFKYYGILNFLSMFIWGPIQEEIIFRVLPLFVTIAFVSKSSRIVFMTTIFFAVLFGAIHPYDIFSKIEIAISGFFFGLVFLKCGGLNSSFVKASVCAMVAHGLTNAFTVVSAWWEFFALTR